MNELLQEIRKLCFRYGIHPIRRRGQNFLVNEEILEKILEIAEIKKDDIILEAGGGLGTLTKKLSEKAKKVLVVEIDPKLVKILKENLKNFLNVEIIFGDILKIKSRKLEGKNFKIVANLPYQITGRFLKKFLTESPKPSLMVLMLQKEVAERICAMPPRMNRLAVITQYFSLPKIVTRVSKNNFWPRPKVDSALIKIQPKEKFTLLSPQEEKKFLALVKTGFSSPRKQLVGNLTFFFSELKLKKKEFQEFLMSLGFDPRIRAENLGLEDWFKILKFFNEKKSISYPSN